MCDCEKERDRDRDRDKDTYRYRDTEKMGRKERKIERGQTL